MRLTMAVIVSAMVAAAATGLAAGQGPQAPQAPPAPYQIVTTPTYEGAIIPASAIPPQLKPFDAGTWTPTPANVATAERQLSLFLQQAVRNPNRVADLIPVNEDITLEGLPDIISGLSTFKRQYMGLTYGNGKARHMLVYGLPDDPEHGWRVRWRLALEGSCRFWWFEFSVDDGRVISFNCQGIN